MIVILKKLLTFLLLVLSLTSCSAFSNESTCNHQCEWMHYSAIEPTCTQNGVKEYFECSKCGFFLFNKPNNVSIVDSLNNGGIIIEKDSRYVAPFGHTFGLGTIIEEPTYDSPGEKLYICQRCFTEKRESILPLKYDYIKFNKQNYSLLFGDVDFNDTNVTSKSESACILNNSFYFSRGHLVFTICSNGKNGDNGLIFGVSDDTITGGLLSYYSLFISENGYLNLLKKVNVESSVLSSVQLLYYSTCAYYEVDLFYSSGHISCYVNNQLFANYYDNVCLDGTKIGFVFSNPNAFITIEDYDNSIEKEDLIDIRNNNYFKLGSFYNPQQLTCGYFIHNEKMKQGTIIRFLGNTKVYKWSLCQIINPEILYSRDWNLFKDGVPYFIDSMWNIDANFQGLDAITTSISFDSYICIFISKIDGSELTKEEILNIPNYIGVTGKVSDGDSINNLFSYSNFHEGYIYDWDDRTKITLRICKKMHINSRVIFNGSASEYKWSVIEKKRFYDEFTAIDIVTKDIYDSKWSDDLDKSSSFLDENKYIVSQDDVFLDLVLSYKDDRRIEGFAIDDFYSFFTIDDDDWGMLPDNSENISFINHRGFSNQAPENTMSAFKLSKQNGFSKVETDVSITKDGVPVLLHDDTINRTARMSDGGEIKDIIKISDITFEEVSQYDFGIWKDGCYSGEKIPTLDEFVAFCAKENIHPYIELKESVPISYVKKCIDIVEKHRMARNCTWISFKKELIAAVNFYDKYARVGYLSMYYKDELLPILGSLKNDLNIVFLDQLYLDIDYTSRLCSSFCFPLEAWTIDNIDVLRKLPKYISGVTSNCLNTSNSYLF